jgi:hypothetical protein
LKYLVNFVQSNNHTNILPNMIYQNGLVWIMKLKFLTENY